ncbi:hypothetical protein [Flavihumibacter stibioxidans]|uniref:hypothetical protein n=1 Tax=Flavihumibacter stibioxidans TaxID=1834163 RepID=UPI0016501BFB|nr:hypothetical protein [Flavihumibacter stibioxidans]
MKKTILLGLSLLALIVLAGSFCSKAQKHGGTEEQSVSKGGADPLNSSRHLWSLL